MSKYGNKKTYVDGIKFDSKKEANRYIELKTLSPSAHTKTQGMIASIATRKGLGLEITPEEQKILDYVDRQAEYLRDEVLNNGSKQQTKGCKI